MSWLFLTQHGCKILNIIPTTVLNHCNEKVTIWMKGHESKAHIGSRINNQIGIPTNQPYIGMSTINNTLELFRRSRNFKCGIGFFSLSFWRLHTLGFSSSIWIFVEKTPVG